MSVPDRSRALHSLLSQLRVERALAEEGEVRASSPAPACDAVLREFLRSFLMWESTSAKADAALARISAAFVDLNEFRVSLVQEMAAAAPGLPRGEDRMRLLKSALNEIFRREHALKLEHLLEKPKRDARAYLDGLPGTPGFVAARTFAVALGGHAVPVDERLRTRLTAAGVVDEGISLDEAAGQLERACKAGEAAEVHRLLQAWSDDGASVTIVKGGRAKGPRASAKRVAASAKRRTTARASSAPRAARKRGS